MPSTYGCSPTVKCSSAPNPAGARPQGPTEVAVRTRAPMEPVNVRSVAAAPWPAGAGGAGCAVAVAVAVGPGAPGDGAPEAAGTPVAGVAAARWPPPPAQAAAASSTQASAAGATSRPLTR